MARPGRYLGRHGGEGLLIDNRFTSWESVFNYADPLWVFKVFSAGIILAVLINPIRLKKHYRIIFLFAGSYAACMQFWSEPELIVDASRYISQAKYLELYGPGYFLREWGREIPVWTDMPVMPLLFGLIFRVFGEVREYIQALTALMFSATVVLTFLIGRRLWDEDTGFAGGVFLLGIPYLYSQVPLMLVDVPLMFFLMLSVYTFILALERGGWLIPLSTVSVCLCFFTKYSSVPALTELPVVLYVYCAGRRESALEGGMMSSRSTDVLLRGLMVFLCSGAVIGLFFWAKHDVVFNQLALLLDYQRPGLGRWGESFASTFLFQAHPVISLAAAWSIWAAMRGRDLSYIIIAWLVILVFALQIRRARYIIMVFPMLGLMAAYGLMRLRSAHMRRFILSSVVISSVVIAFFAYRPYLNEITMVNLKTAGEFLDRLPGADAEVFTVYDERPPANPAVAVPILDLFTRKNIRYEYNDDGKQGPYEQYTSSLRFTWEYRNPAYYAGDAGKGNRYPAAVVVIADRPSAPLPGDIKNKVGKYRKSRLFSTDENEFMFRTIVTVYYDPENSAY
ncbi:MAG: glycosyltransferase family 39 protein [Nitrospirae bacterium]|nr:glycosyltransferase family 39 protein [Nitrospirota bacterium]